MRMLLVSDGSFAQELYIAMGTFYPCTEISYFEVKPDSREKNKRWLRSYLLESNEKTIVLCDSYGSRACHEISECIQELCKWENMVLICGMNLPMVFKIYGLKDYQDLNLIALVYEHMENKGIYIFEKNKIYRNEVSA